MYVDPAVPAGVEGKEALVGYFTRLLRRYPDWVWTNVRAIPLEDGFLNIWRNKVYFDRTPLLAAQGG